MNGFKKKPAAPAPAASNQEGPGTKPTHVLKMKNEKGEMITLSNLFVSTSKSGDSYLRGKDRETGHVFYVYEKTEYKK